MFSQTAANPEMVSWFRARLPKSTPENRNSKETVTLSLSLQLTTLSRGELVHWIGCCYELLSPNLLSGKRHLVQLTREREGFDHKSG